MTEIYKKVKIPIFLYVKAISKNIEVCLSSVAGNHPNVEIIKYGGTLLI